MHMIPATTLLDHLREDDLTLPGQQAHRQLSPIQVSDYQLPTEGYREAAVMLLLYPKEGQWYTVYIERARSHPADKHAGQISLPGGKAELEDHSHSATAAREVEEEVGVEAATIEIIRPLTKLYVAPSNFVVYPFVGMIDYEPSFVPQVTEVAGIIESPIAYIHGMPVEQQDMQVRGEARRSIPYYNLHGHTLWGATSMITAEFKALIEDLTL